MKVSEVTLPSNRNFGIFFSAVFFAVFLYFWHVNNVSAASGFFVLALLTFITTLVSPVALLPFNKLWMSLGLLLGMIVNPVVLGLIFFGIFTPVAFLMRLFGRDELKIKFAIKNSYWINRNTLNNAESFKRQF